jgi:diaminopimelate epimerase
MRAQVVDSNVIAVTKMHGTQNDFVVVDLRTQRVDDLAAFARYVCDRRSGIGADGIIALLAPQSAQATVAMRVVNADGSDAEMCGNGVRCAARWLYEAGEGGAIAFETGAGIVRSQVIATQPEFEVRVTMGRPMAELLDGDDRAWFVDLGNPHVVLVREAADEGELGSYAHALQNDRRFPNGTNVHVVVPHDEHLDVLHWERGVGPTRACGTGAVAAAEVAAHLRNHRTPVDVHVPGGKLTVEWDADGNASLTGPAVRVFDTTVPRDAFGRP